MHIIVSVTYGLISFFNLFYILLGHVATIVRLYLQSARVDNIAPFFTKFFVLIPSEILLRSSLRIIYTEPSTLVFPYSYIVSTGFKYSDYCPHGDTIPLI